MSVPDEAVEAAAMAAAKDEDASNWHDESEYYRNGWRNRMQVGLEAAAPFIAAPVEAELRKARGTIATLMKLAEVSSKVGDLEKAQAWDEGEDAGARNLIAEQWNGVEPEKNPYRSGEVAPSETPTMPAPEPWPAGLRDRLIAAGWLKK